MSKRFGSILFPVAALLLILHLSDDASSQALRVAINLNSAKAVITGERNHSTLPKNPRNLSFRSTPQRGAGGVPRVSDLRAYGRERAELEVKKLIEGEYVVSGDVFSWAYSIELTPFKSATAAAHGSWLAADHGLLMLDDLIPLGAATDDEVVAVVVTLPDGWRAYSPGDSEMLENTIQTSNYSDGVIVIGKDWRARAISPKGITIGIHIRGNWHFSDEEAAQMTEEIVRRYSESFGPTTATRSSVFVLGFPVDVKPGNWEAETRGNTVMIVSADMPFRTQSLQRLHEQLRHEIFHLWIPNGVNLTGNYDWFYEGFALYQSLKVAVSFNRIRFEDFLDTLSRAHTIDSAYSQRPSLIQASATRFSGANTQVYARGMLVAFLCDLAMLRESRGKRSVEGIVREVFQKHRKPNPPADGNTAVIALLKSNMELRPIVDKYVTGSQTIDWTSDLGAAGITDIDSGPITTLRVKEKPDGREKTLLDKLGYNNWRKLSSNSR